ncbi:MAG: hypothetical protein P4L27_10780 [Ignavibacteriaceae bacterium]|nr:hypothetical protein [Ignavibacteriaceae bacterium]
MFELIIPERPKTETKQFTITMKIEHIDELVRQAKEQAITFHKLTRAILISYIEYIKGRK